MRTKKVLVLALCLATALVLAGCGGSDEKSASNDNGKVIGTQPGNEHLLFSEYRDAEGNFDFQGATVKMMWYIDDDQVDKWKKIENFEKDCNAKVEIVEAGWGDGPTKLSASVASGDPADIVYVYATWYPDYIISDFLQPIDDYVPLAMSLASDDDIYYFNDNELDYFKWGDKRYVFANSYSPSYVGLFYNTAMFDEMGLEYPYELEKKGEWTHEKFMEYAKILSVDKDGDGVTDQFGVQESNLLGMMLLSNDTDVVKLERNTSDGPSRIALSDPATIRSLTAFETMKATDKSLGGVLVDGTAAMAFSSWGIRPDLTTNFTFDGWGFCGAPKGPDYSSGKETGVATDGWGIIKGSENQVAATILIHYYLNTDGTIDFTDEQLASQNPLALGNRGFKDEADRDRFFGYMANVAKNDGHVLDVSLDGEIGTKPLATLIEEYEPQYEASLDKLLSTAGIVMAGDGEPFANVTYKFENDVDLFLPNAENTTNVMLAHTSDNGGALNIKTDTLEAWDLYATTDPEALVFEPGHKYKVSFDYTLKEALGEGGRYYLVFQAGDKNLSDTHFGFEATVGEKDTYEIEINFYDDIAGGHLRFGGFNTSDILIENLTIETVN